MEDVMAEKCSLRNEYSIHILQPFCVKIQTGKKETDSFLFSRRKIK
jgi:hypothetical protein